MSELQQNPDFEIPVGPQQMYSKNGIYFKIEVIYEVKISVRSKVVFQNLGLFQNRVFTVLEFRSVKIDKNSTLKV